MWSMSLLWPRAKAIAFRKALILTVRGMGRVVANGGTAWRVRCWVERKGREQRCMCGQQGGMWGRHGDVFVRGWTVDHRLGLGVGTKPLRRVGRRLGQDQLSDKIRGRFKVWGVISLGQSSPLLSLGPLVSIHSRPSPLITQHSWPPCSI